MITENRIIKYDGYCDEKRFLSGWRTTGDRGVRTFAVIRLYRCIRFVILYILYYHRTVSALTTFFCALTTTHHPVASFKWRTHLFVIDVKFCPFAFVICFPTPRLPIIGKLLKLSMYDIIIDMCMHSLISKKHSPLISIFRFNFVYREFPLQHVW